MRLVSVAFMAALLWISGSTEASRRVVINQAAKQVALPQICVCNSSILFGCSRLEILEFLAIWNNQDATNPVGCRCYVDFGDQPLKLPQP